MAPFRAVFVGDQIKVTMVVDVADGAPVCRSYQVERTDGGGLEFMTTEIMRGLNLRTLLANACAASQWSRWTTRPPTRQRRASRQWRP